MAFGTVALPVPSDSLYYHLFSFLFHSLFLHMRFHCDIGFPLGVLVAVGLRCFLLPCDTSVMACLTRIYHTVCML